MSRLFVFDMDGTLLPKTTGLIEIAKLMGHADFLHSLEREYGQKKINEREFAEKCLHLWDQLTPELVKQAFDSTPKMENIREVLAEIKKRGAVSCLITAAPNFFADHFKDYGFDHIFASEPYCLNAREFHPAKLLHGKDKPILAQKLCQALDYAFEETIAFGDSLSDLPLFEVLKYTISVNGDDHIQKHAMCHYQGTDLHAAYSLVQCTSSS